jgi:hypothetical protein
MLRPAGISTAAKARITRSSNTDLGDTFDTGDVFEIFPESLCNSGVAKGIIPNSGGVEGLAKANFVGNFIACDLAFDHKATCIDGSSR